MKTDPSGGTSSLSGAEVFREVVLAQGELSMRAHKTLYAFDDNRYLVSEGDIIASVVSAAEKGPVRLHISAGWDDLLKVVLWTSGRPGMFEVLSLLRKSGLTEAELAPFSRSDPQDLFPWLYYGRKFDVLRRLCNAAKSRAEAKLNRKDLHIYFHLTSEDTGQIIASSL